MDGEKKEGEVVVPAYVIKNQPKLHFKHHVSERNAEVFPKRPNFGDTQDAPCQNSNRD